MVHHVALGLSNWYLTMLILTVPPVEGAPLHPPTASRDLPLLRVWYSVLFSNKLELTYMSPAILCRGVLCWYNLVGRSQWSYKRGWRPRGNPFMRSVPEQWCGCTVQVELPKAPLLGQFGVLQGLRQQGWFVACTDGPAKRVEEWIQAGKGAWYGDQSPLNYDNTLPAHQRQSINRGELRASYVHCCGRGTGACSGGCTLLDPHPHHPHRCQSPTPLSPALRTPRVLP